MARDQLGQTRDVPGRNGRSSGKSKKPPFREGRGEVTVVDDEIGHAVLPAEIHYLPGVVGIISRKEVLQPGPELLQ